MRKKWIFIIIFLTTALTIAGLIYRSRRTPYYNSFNRPIRPDTTVFAFDLHNVVLDVDFTKVIKLLWYDFLRYAPTDLLLGPKTWSTLHAFTQDNLSMEYLFDKMAQKYETSIPFKKLFSDIISAQDLNYKTLGLLFALKFYGYKLYILSNIWNSSLLQLFRKYPLLKDLFDGYYIPSEENNYIAKPSGAFYLGFKKYLKAQGQNSKQIVFVDNSDDNVKSARRMGLHAIEFNSINNLIKFLIKEHVIGYPSKL